MSEQTPLTYEEYEAISEKMRPEPGTPEWKEYWKKNIELAQRVHVYEVETVDYPRIPYGKETRWERYAKEYGDSPTPTHPCHDCNVEVGMLHVPGCDVEDCPACGYQAISCGCGSDNEEDEEA